MSPKDAPKKIVDIAPRGKNLAEKMRRVLSGPPKAEEQISVRHPLRSFLGPFLALVIIAVFLTLLLVRLAAAHFSSSVSASVRDFEQGASDLERLRPGEARADFQSAQDRFSAESGAAGKLWSLVSGGGFFSSVEGVSADAIALSEELSAAQSSFPALFWGGKGGELLAQGESILGTARRLDAEMGTISQAASDAGAANLGEYAAFELRLRQYEAGLSALLRWLKSGGTHHIAVLFGNPSELRPGGGFTGSYADLAIASGSFAGFTVKNIADADAASPLYVIPPQPLRGITARWNAANANWFFDFGDSAIHTLEFLNASPLYAGRAASSTYFDAVAAISPRVVEDVLRLTGPLTAASGTTISADNFYETIDSAVREAEARGRPGPKRILGEIASQVLRALASGSASSTGASPFDLLSGWLSRRDAMVYFSDPALEDFARQEGWGGTVYELPDRFEGDYFALAEANIGGEKSGAVMDEKIVFESQLDESGIVHDRAEIIRHHNGDKSAKWWYRTPHKAYTEIFTLTDAAPLASEGIAPYAVSPLVRRYGPAYDEDPLLGAIESGASSPAGFPGLSQSSQSDKNVFSFWTVTPRGATSTALLDYGERLFAPLGDGSVYQFVFEKQAGSRRTYDFTISAPVGYVFKENGLASYEYYSDDPPGTLVLTLTLEKSK